MAKDDKGTTQRRDLKCTNPQNQSSFFNTSPGQAVADSTTTNNAKPHNCQSRDDYTEKSHLLNHGQLENFSPQPSKNSTGIKYAANSVRIKHKDEQTTADTHSIPEAIKQADGDSKSESEIESDGVNVLSQNNKKEINRKSSKRLVPNSQPNNTSNSDSSILSNSNNSIKIERQKISASFPQLHGLAPVFSMLLSEDEVDNELTDLPGLQDRSEIYDDDSDEETEGPPMQPSNPNTPNTYTSESQSRRGTKR